MSVIVNMPACPGSRALHVSFLDGGNGGAARLAGHLVRALAAGHLQLEEADFGHTDATRTPNSNQADLVVVIHAPGDPGPVVVDYGGGRIDWHLGLDSVIDCPFDLTRELRQHATRLLDDLGIPHRHSEALAMQRPYPSAGPHLPIRRINCLPPIAGPRHPGDRYPVHPDLRRRGQRVHLQHAQAAAATGEVALQRDPHGEPGHSGRTGDYFGLACGF